MRYRPWPVILLVLGACARKGPEPQGLQDQGVLVDARARTYLEAVSAALVQGMVGPEGRVFEVGLRTPKIQSFPCGSCHGGGDAHSTARPLPGHRDLDPVHPRALADKCVTCHLPQDPARLALATGESVTLDHGYRLCAQCHFAQAEAWAGGAHGKRVATWEGRRVVLSCTGCHDAHNPAFPKRLPQPGPSVSRRSR